MPTTKARIAVIISSSGDTGVDDTPPTTTPTPPPTTGGDTGPGPHIAIYDVDFYDDPDARYGP